MLCSREKFSSTATKCVENNSKKKKNWVEIVATEDDVVAQFDGVSNYDGIIGDDGALWSDFESLFKEALKLLFLLHENDVSNTNIINSRHHNLRLITTTNVTHYSKFIHVDNHALVSMIVIITWKATVSY